MPCVINFPVQRYNDSMMYKSFTLLENNLVFIHKEILKFREIGNNIKVKEFFFNSEQSCLKAFNFLMELMKTNPPVIVDIAELVENTDAYIDNFYQKKNQ